MRIRKRFLLSSLSSLPLSDPQLNRSSPLVQQQHQEGCNTISQPSDSPNQPPPPPSDQNVTRWVFSGRRKELDGEEEEKSNDIKKGSISGAEVNSGFLQKTASSHQDGRWSEEDKVVPPKKRRGSFERRDSDEAEKEKKMKAKMKSKTNKKCIQLPNGDDEEETKEGNIIGDSNISLKKKKKVKRGNVIMEGSRCSRVNGRGWRCCQQTLVGYSLCEHHLGKGRVRSMSSVRNRAMANTTRAPKKDGLGLLSTSAAGKLGQRLFEEEDDEEDDGDDDDDYEEEEEEEEKLLMMTKKRRRKIGMVKARSISSLLGQTNSAVVIVNDHKTETAAAVDGDK